MSAAPDPSNPADASATLTDVEYRRLTDAVLRSLEQTADRWLQDDVVDIDTHRTGGLLEFTLPGGSKLIVNTQPPLHELWLAARRGGFHFKWDGQVWRDTRSGAEFFDLLSQCASEQTGRALRFEPLSA